MKLEFSSINGLRNCLRRGIGYTVCPIVAIGDELADGSLVALAWDREPLETSVVMIWHAEKWCSPLLRYFMLLCEEAFTD